MWEKLNWEVLAHGILWGLVRCWLELQSTEGLFWMIYFPEVLCSQTGRSLLVITQNPSSSPYRLVHRVASFTQSEKPKRPKLKLSFLLEPSLRRNIVSSIIFYWSHSLTACEGRLHKGRKINRQGLLQANLGADYHSLPMISKDSCHSNMQNILSQSKDLQKSYSIIPKLSRFLLYK